MRKTIIIIVVYSFFAIVHELHAQAHTIRDSWETLNLIRREKFDIILPNAMRENAIDMWIHAIQRGNPDPLSLDLGGNGGYFIFTDRGGDRIERAVLGGGGIMLRKSGAYDIFGSQEDLRQFVSERDPQRIGVNMSEWIAVADGLSHTRYKKLVEILGKQYAGRLVSADRLITDFKVRRVSSEIAFYAALAGMTAEISERALSNEIITPGVTTLEDVAWWMKEQNIGYGINYLFRMPSVAVITGPNRIEFESHERIIQRGDLLKTDMGMSILNYSTDVMRMGYVLREGETEVPQGFRNAYEQALKVRDVIRVNFKAGKTAAETLKILGNAIENAGFGFILEDPTMDGGFSGVKMGDHIKYPDKTEVAIDFHALGGEIPLGPSITNFRRDRAQLTVHPNGFFSFEFMAYTAVPEWGGKKVRIGYEENAIITERGVEWLYPPADKILLIK